MFHTRVFQEGGLDVVREGPVHPEVGQRRGEQVAPGGLPLGEPLLLCHPALVSHVLTMSVPKQLLALRANHDTALCGYHAPLLEFEPVDRVGKVDAKPTTHLCRIREVDVCGSAGQRVPERRYFDTSPLVLGDDSVLGAGHLPDVRLPGAVKARHELLGRGRVQILKIGLDLLHAALFDQFYGFRELIFPDDAPLSLPFLGRVDDAHGAAVEVGFALEHADGFRTRAEDLVRLEMTLEDILLVFLEALDGRWDLLPGAFLL
mmetsp:Transcript_11100/g.31010  ORF Transcript_11100/g.31010 Transcript_11100/m.31010 type:complete len:261 (-) Transcript_11100:1108-1890(-)